MADDSTTKSTEQTIRESLRKLADVIIDASGLDVITNMQVIDLQNPDARTSAPVKIASTHIALDGDREIFVPVVLNSGEMQISQAIYDLHERNVKDAVAYRKEILDSLVDFVKTRRIG